MCLIPSSERCCVHLDDGGFRQGVGADEFVVRRVEGDDNDTDLTGDTLTAPGEVTAIETQGAVLGVASPGTDKVDSLVANTSVGRLTTFLERSTKRDMSETFFFFMFCLFRRGGCGLEDVYTSSFDSMRALHQLQTACGGCLGRYP